jgi:hypothetical protein
MKRSLVVTLLVVGLSAVAGSMLVNRQVMNADGNPPPPPGPWMNADGNPPPPPGPWMNAG